MKYTFLKKSIFLGIALFICAIPVFALELDTSVDDEIRRTYDPSKLEQSLPVLPKTAPAQNSAGKTPQNTHQSPQPPDVFSQALFSNRV